MLINKVCLCFRLVCASRNNKCVPNTNNYVLENLKTFDLRQDYELSLFYLRSSSSYGNAGVRKPRWGKIKRWWIGLWKMRSLGKFYPSLGISHNLTNGSRSLRFCVCRSHICLTAIDSLHFFVSGSDFKKPVSASRRVSDLPFATPK